MTVASITWTRFLDRAATSKREQLHEWRELVEHIAHAGPYAAKSVCPWIKLARFGEARSTKGAYRHDGNMLEITGVEGDYDGEKVSPEQAMRLLERAGLRCIVYTSPSHTEQAPRWRVLAPLSRPHVPADRTRLLARVNGALGGILTGESFTLSQSYYYGRVQGQDTYRVLVAYDDPEDGQCVDEADDLDAIAIAKAPRERTELGQPGHSIAAAVERLGRRLRTGDGRRELLKSYIGDRSNRGLPEDEVRALVEDVTSRFFDPADPIDWANVNGLITDICSADTAQRDKVQAVVGGFVDRVVAGKVQAQQDDQHSATLPLVYSEDITSESARVDQLVEDFITAGGLSVMYGESNSGKSFLACDMACHLSTGLDWLGKRTVPGAVLYVAGEGAQSIKLRVLAWRQERGESPSMAIVPTAINLLDPRADLTKVMLACEAVRAHYSLPVSLIVIDTLARAFGGGNENDSEDMGAVIIHADQLRATTGAHVMFVHHSGKDSAKGSRGHSSLKAATDTEIEVTGDAETKLHTASITKQRDLGSRGEQITAKFRVVEMGRGQWDKPITTCVVEESTGQAAMPKSKQAKGSALQSAIVDTLGDAPNNTLKRSELVRQLTERGFSASPIYRAIGQLAQQSVLTEVLNMVHLNGRGTCNED